MIALPTNAVGVLVDVGDRAAEPGGGLVDAEHVDAGKQLAQLDELAGVAGREHQRPAHATDLALRRGELADPDRGEIEHRVELLAIERAVLGGALDLDQRAVLGADHVHVDLGPGVLDVRQIEHDLAADDADRDRRDRRAERARSASLPVATSFLIANASAIHAPVIEATRVPPSARQHVAIDRDRALAELREIDRRAQRAPDQPLDLLAAAAGIALGAGVGRARQHRVLGGEPAPALAGEERRHAVLDARGAQHPGVAELDQRRALGVLLVVRDDLERTELVGRLPSGRMMARRLPQTPTDERDAATTSSGPDQLRSVRCEIPVRHWVAIGSHWVAVAVAVAVDLPPAWRRAIGSAEIASGIPDDAMDESDR